MLFYLRIFLFIFSVANFCSLGVHANEKSSIAGFGFDEEKIDPKKQEAIDIKNQQWKVRNIRRVRHVNRAYDDYEFGAIEPVGALVRALDHDNDNVREAAYEALIKVGKEALDYLIEMLNTTNVYLVKKEIMMLMARTGEDEIVLPILEKAYKDDPRLEQEVLSALRSMRSTKAHSMSLRIMQSRHQESRTAVDNRIEELGERRVFSSLGLKWGETRENLLTVAWRISQYKRATNPTSKQVEDYELLHQMLHRFVKEFDEELGEGAGIRFLKDNGYDESILEL